MDITLSSSRLAYSSSLSFLAANSNSLLLKKPRIPATRTTKPLTCNALFGLGVPELAVIAGVAVLVFGPKNLPQLGRSLGKTINGFQQAAKEFESEIKKEPDSTEENPAEKPTAVSEQQEQEIKVSSTKDTDSV